jgi:hypothetical protein
MFAGTDTLQLNTVFRIVPGTSEAKRILAAAPLQIVSGEAGVATRSGKGFTLIFENTVGAAVGQP